LWAVFEVPHVALGDHPVAEVRAAQNELLAVGVDEMLALRADELCGERE
jgi:5,10-methylenetetrahydrofolate reductase